MTEVRVTDQSVAELKQLAHEDNRPLEELVQEAIDCYVSARFTEVALSQAQIDRLRHSLEQANRGEFVPYEQVMARFDDFKKRLGSR